MTIDWTAFLERTEALLREPIAQSIVGAVIMLLVLAGCRLAARTGHHAAFGLLLFVPGVNLVAFLWLAFGPWPVKGELKQLRRVAKVAKRADERLANRSA